MRSIVGREVGAAQHHDGIDRLLWLDLTAGNGIVDDESLEWKHNCSPGIVARYACNSDKPITVVLHEIKPATFGRLEKSLLERLPELGYVLVDGEWRYKNATVQLVAGSGADASADAVNWRTAVLVTNDPNAITDWAMRPTFAAEIRARTKWFRSISTMGCNPAGLKRLGIEDRLGWFELIEQQRKNLPAHHDLFLAAIEKDDAQWAYLIDESDSWRSNLERDATKAFANQGLSIEFAWLRRDQERFVEIQRRLFLTRKELDAA